MNMFETISVPEHHPTKINVDECRLEYQHSAQSSWVGGRSSLPLRLLNIAMVLTIPLPVDDVDLASNGIEASFVFPSSYDLVEDQYSRIREEIVASGLPMLSDDEVRAEIRERKGVRGDTES
jgi:hypothetical protein